MARFASSITLSAIVVAAVALSVSPANAEGIVSANSRRMAATLNVGGTALFAGPLGGGFRVTPEFHFAFGWRGVAGPSIGVGLDLLVPGVGLGAFARFSYNIQPLDGVAFFVTPYGGLTAGGVFNDLFAGFYLGVHFGGEVRFIFADRFFLTVRPLGFSVPIFVGAGVGFGYDGALGFGATF